MTKKSGFSMIEIILVLGIGVSLAFIKFQDMIHDQEIVKASAAGQQIKQLGEAVNGYINIRYDKLSTLVNSVNNGTDPGPRTCTIMNSLCTITSQTLVNEGLLPSTNVAKNSFGSDYTIQLKRSGTSPNYIIDGIVVTNSAWIDGNNIRYDLIGRAMQAAGIDSGMSKSTTQVDGYNGSWNYTSSNFPAINKAGILGYRVGYNSAMYSVYLRRDGTLPMTGNLNMGGQSIYNAIDITASGTTTTDLLKTNGIATIGSDLNVSGNTQVNNNINSNNKISGEIITSRSETYTQNWFRTLGDGGIYFQKYGGGWNMTDANNINAYNGKNIKTTSGIYGAYIHSTGNINVDNRINIGEFLYINGKAIAGNSCSPNGLIGRDNNGLILSCNSGVWISGGSTQVITGNNPTCPSNKIPIARYWTQTGGSNYGSYCSLQTGWAGVTMPSCESCANWEKCHMVYSQVWSAVACS